VIPVNVSQEKKVQIRKNRQFGDLAKFQAGQVPQPDQQLGSQALAHDKIMQS